MDRSSAVLVVLFCATVPVLHGDRSGFLPRRLLVCLSEDGGCVLGTTEDGQDRSYEAWYGIPYATPPINELRFQDPLPPSPISESVRDCTVPRDPCVQTDVLTDQVIGTEDCLYLNVYRPKRFDPERKLLPVIVVISVGYFKFGSGRAAYYGPDFLMDTEEAIVVTFDHRLGIFGFLASGDRSCKGNFGLKDQVMALKWVQSNIEQFGGDPTAVTLMGHDAGAMSAHYLMMSKQANGLFKKAILRSGSALSPWALTKDPESQFREYAARAGIRRSSSRSSREIVGKLRDMPFASLQRFSDNMNVFHKLYPIFRPTIEGDWSGAIVKDHPRKVWKSGKFQQRPFLLTGHGNEPEIFADMYYNKTQRRKFMANWEHNLNVATGIPVKALRPIRDHYFDGRPTNTNFINILSALRDILLWVPIYDTVKLYTQYANVKKNPVDLFLFNYTTSFSLSELFNEYADPKRGAGHLDIELFIFKRAAVEPPFIRDKSDMEVTRFIVKSIMQYVKQGMKYSEDYPRCTAKNMDGRWCDYLLLQRKRKSGGFLLTHDNYFDMDALKAVHDANEIASELEGNYGNRG